MNQIFFFFFQQMCDSLWSYVNTPYTHTTFYSEEVSRTASMTQTRMTFYFPLSVSPSGTQSSHHSCHGDTGCMQINRQRICWTWRMMKIDFLRRVLVDEWCWWSHSGSSGCLHFISSQAEWAFPSLTPRAKWVRSWPQRAFLLSTDVCHRRYKAPGI